MGTTGGGEMLVAQEFAVGTEVRYQGAAEEEDRAEPHVRVFYSRPTEVCGFHSHAEARSTDEPEGAHHDVGFLVALAGIAAPGDDFVLGPRYAAGLPAHGWIEQPHVQLEQGIKNFNGE
jgi:hypothetical protein